MQPDKIGTAISAMNWPAVVLVIVVLLAIIIPVYKNSGIWPFSKKTDDDSKSPKRDGVCRCADELRQNINDSRDRIIQIGVKVESVEGSVNVMRDAVSALSGGVKELIKFLKND